jgi:DNA-binding transcriptional ArsR family regulator
VKTQCSTQVLQTETEFRRAADVFKALGHVARVRIVNALADGEHNVAELTELVKLDISTVSNHLAVLRNVGLVTSERRGTQVFYTLRRPCLMNIFCCLNDFDQ